MKDFTEWHALKTELQHRNPPSFKERDIWWCHLGLNLGHEQDGKHSNFQRPVVILRKYNARSFLALPLTSQHREHPYHFGFHFHGQKRSALLSQPRMLDSLRLMRSMGRIRPEVLTAMKAAFCATLENTQPRHEDGAGLWQ